MTTQKSNGYKMALLLNWWTAGGVSTSLPSRIAHFDHDDSTMDYISKSDLLSTLHVVCAAFLTSLVVHHSFAMSKVSQWNTEQRYQQYVVYCVQWRAIARGQ